MTAPTVSSFHAWPVAENINWIKGVDAKGNYRPQRAADRQADTVCPSIGGGRSGIMALYIRATNLFYTTGIEWCQAVTVKKEEPKEGLTFFGGVFELRKPPIWRTGGHLDACDPVTGKKFWSELQLESILCWPPSFRHRRQPCFYRRPRRQLLRA